MVTWSGGGERRASGEDLPARVGTAFHSHFAGRTPDGDGQKLTAWIRVGWGGRDGEQNVQPQQSVIRRAGVAMNERPRERISGHGVTFKSN